MKMFLPNLILILLLPCGMTGCHSGKTTPADGPTEAGAADTVEVVAQRRPNGTGIVLSEISASGKQDYIELHNTSSAGIDLGGYGLSDRETRVRYRFPSGTRIEAGSYLAVYEVPLKNGEDHVYFYDPEGYIILEYGPVSMPKGQALVSVQGCPFITTDLLTPGETNETAGLPPAASVASGQYDGVDTLEVKLFAEGDIRYTLNGAPPGAGSTRYTKPFRLTKTTVLRAVAVGEDGSLSPVSSFTYLINEGHQLDAVSLVSEPGGLFSTGSGIYSNGPYRLKPHGTEDDGTPGINYPYTQANYWRKWWRKSNVSFLPKQDAGFSIDCGAAIFGGFSRINAKKSLKFKFKKEYGPSKLHYKLFPNRDESEYNIFIVRTGGQDVYGTLIKDDLASSLAEGMIDVMATRPVVFYINGQYYGIYHIREKINKQFVAAHHKIPKDSLDIIMGNSSVEEGSGKDWRALYNYIRSHDLSKPEYYRYVTDRMDVLSFADWVVAETYIGNSDTGNVRIFRSPFLDGKWHWILYDVDMGFPHYNSDSFLILYRPTQVMRHQTDVIRGLLRSKEFRDLFVYRLEYQMTSIWNRNRVNAAIDQMAGNIDSEVARNNKRWQGSYPLWQKKIEGLHQFADGRQKYLRQKFGTDPLLRSLVKMTPEELDRCFPDAKEQGSTD